MKLLDEVKTMKVRTPTEKTVKKALISLIDPEAEVDVNIDLDNLESNNKDVLVAYAEREGIEAEDPKHKADYVEAIKNHISG